VRRLIVSEFVTLDGVMQAPGGKDEDVDGGFAHGGWTVPYWHDDIGKSFDALLKECDTLLLGRRTYVTHAAAFEPMAPGDPFGDPLNSVDLGKRQARAAGRRTCDLRPEVGDALSYQRGGPSLRAPSRPGQLTAESSKRAVRLKRPSGCRLTWSCRPAGQPR
jgi:hypothetical protein